MTARDRGCAHPGCDLSPSWCQVHHIAPWAHHGQTRIENLVMVCAVHHRLVHQSGWEIRVPDGRPEFVPPGWIDPRRRPRRKPDTNQVVDLTTMPDPTTKTDGCAVDGGVVAFDALSTAAATVPVSFEDVDVPVPRAPRARAVTFDELDTSEPRPPGRRAASFDDLDHAPADGDLGGPRVADFTGPGTEIRHGAGPNPNRVVDGT